MFDRLWSSLRTQRMSRLTREATDSYDIGNWYRPLIDVCKWTKRESSSVGSDSHLAGARCSQLTPHRIRLSNRVDIWRMNNKLLTDRSMKKVNKTTSTSTDEGSQLTRDDTDRRRRRAWTWSACKHRVLSNVSFCSMCICIILLENSRPRGLAISMSILNVYST